jgi:hypothetical protein
VASTETRSEPRQPKRLLKKKNMSHRYPSVTPVKQRAPGACMDGFNRQRDPAPASRGEESTAFRSPPASAVSTSSQV